MWNLQLWLDAPDEDEDAAVVGGVVLVESTATVTSDCFGVGDAAESKLMIVEVILLLYTLSPHMNPNLERS